ncbi:PglZ domain-containing protein [Gelatiniphilus marinus]|uniref:PglZ domain-containing protein n=1 Tax=Gelatiniphilus marinus TaxID=1759464 RepID=A0ABW5JVR9_9FLAO
MSWQQRIITALNLSEKSPKIISDRLGVLFSKPFKTYLNQNFKHVVFSNKNAQMLTAANSSEQVTFITTKENIPQFLKSSYDYKEFNNSQLPLNGDLTLLKQFDASTIVMVLEYVYASNPHIVLSNSNINEIVANAKSHHQNKELTELKEIICKELEKDSSITNTLTIAEHWGKFIYQSFLQNQQSFIEDIPQIDEVAKQLIDNKTFEQIGYASTASKPLSIDKIIHHIKSKKEDKIALLCFDCMGFAEWQLLKDYLSDLELDYKEHTLFTLLPSVTSVCRTAIFHGATNVYDIKYPGRNDEAKAFTEFFNDKQTKYFVEEDEISDNTLLGYEYISVLFNFFDDLCHSTIFPANENTKAIYFNNCKQYLEKSNVKQIIKTLLKNGFQIYICSDHGSVIAKGNGERLQKYLIDDFAKRAVIIPEEASELTQFEKINIPFVHQKKLVIPEGRTMFSQKDKIEINHGGISLEEIVVPFITVTK